MSYVYNGYAWDLLSGPTAALVPTKITTLTSGSGTYSVTSGTVFLDVQLVGGGGGGTAGANAAAGSNGGSTTFGSLTAGGGTSVANPNVGQGGTASGGDVNCVGGMGTGGAPSDGAAYAVGGHGGASFFGSGGGGVYANAGNAGVAFGSGGAGGSTTSGAQAYGGSGGGAGGYVRKLISGPAATYSYAVGTAGNGGVASGAGLAGGAGAAGVVIVTEYGGSSAAPVTVPNIKVVTASGTYTPSAGLVAAIVEVVGGGGSGGAAASTSGQSHQGAGGGGGGYSRRLLTAAQIGASQTVTIGAGGAGTNGNGNDGGATTFGSLCTANGGKGGGLANTGTNPIGGVGGVAGTGDFAVAGAVGGWGLYSTSSSIAALSGNGAVGPFGGGAVTIIAAAGTAATGYGAGGSGGHANSTATVSNGGAGSPGVCIVTEFIQQGGAAAAALPGAKVLISSQTVGSAVAQVDFTTGIDNTYDEYEFHLLLVKPTANAALLIRISQDGGATWKSGTSDYTYAFYASYATSASSGPSATNTNQIYLTSTQLSGALGIPINGTVRFYAPSNTANRKPFMYDVVFHQATLGSGRVVGVGHYNVDNNAINGVRFLLDTSTIAQGTFNLYGIKK